MPQAVLADSTTLPEIVTDTSGIEAPLPEQCSIGGCIRPAHSRGLCGTHYNCTWRRGELGEAKLRNGRPRSPFRPCKVSECGDKAKTKGFCGKHYQRFLRYGDPNTKNPPGSRPGERRHPNITEKGYVLVYRPEHPNARPDGRIAEHRLVMSEKIGRLLFQNENVHHRNGVKKDNSPNNLELWITSQPSGQRVQDLVAWAKEILRLYPDELLERLEAPTSIAASGL